MDYASLSTADFAALDNAANAWSGVSSTTAELKDDYEYGVRRSLDTWATEVTVDREQATINLRQQFVGAAAEAGALTDTLRGAIEEFERLQRKLAVVVSDAVEQYGVTVDATGLVTYPPMPDMLREHPSLMKEWAVEAARVEQLVVTDINAVLTEATTLDAETAAKLRAISEVGSPGDITFNDNALSAALGTEIPVASDPQAVHGWWESLTPEQRKRYIEMCPSLVGGLDGIPATDRDAANRIVLDREEDAIRAQIEILANEMSSEPAGDEGPWHDHRVQKDALQAKLEGLQAIEDRISLPPDINGQRHYLLKIDASGDGKAIVSFGNPDTADNVAVYVPGTSSDIATIGVDLDRMDAMGADAANADPNATTASILWLGYDAPNVVTDASDIAYADHAGADLDRFTDGLRATHEGTPSNTTLIGHSYGTTVIGTAARDHGLDVNNMIMVASPGVGVDNAAALGIPADHVWATRADSDPIGMAKDPSDAAWSLIPAVAGYRFLTGYDTDLLFGADPSGEDFGGHSFSSGLSSGHTGYWDEGNPARDNIANIITGHPENVS